MTLPRAYFHEPAIFAAESAEIFSKQWLCVGRASQLREAGSYFLCEVGTESILVVRDRDGVAHAHYNVCRHRGTRLCTEAQGQFNGSIQCPYHAWTYGLDGKLIGAPNMRDVANFQMADYPLHPIAVREWAGFLLINLAPSPQPIEQAFAPLNGRLTPWNLEQLVVAQRVAYTVQANWKLIFQNYNECYHCPTVHPVLNSLTPYRNSSNDLDTGAILGGPMAMSNPGGSMTMSGRACAAPLTGVTGDNLGLVYYYTIFPTLFLSLHPDYVLTHRLERLSSASTRVVCEWLFAPQAVAQPNFSPQDAVEFWDMTNRQDWQVCELSQLGTRSQAYTPGPYANLEDMPAAFDREYLRVMQSNA